MSIEGDRNFGGAFSPGEVLTAAKMNDLSAAAGYGKQWHSSGSQMAQGTFGTVDMNRPPLAEGQIYDYPFKVSVSSGTSEGQWKVFIRAGTVNSFIPKVLNGPMAGKYLDETPQPYLELTSSSTSVKYVILRATVAADKKFFPNTTDVYLADSLEALTDSNENGHILIASISLTKEGSVIKSVSISQYIYAALALIRVKGGSQTVWNWTSR